MSLTRTKLGAGTKFGSPTKFGFTYNLTDVFPTDTATDLDNILLEVGRGFTVVEQSDTTDTMGEVTAISDTEKAMYCYIEDISKKDRQIHDMGLAVPGNVKGFFKPTYPIFSGGVVSVTYVVKEGDILKENNDNIWRVEKIMGERHISNVMIFKVAVLKKIDLSPTS